MALIEFDLFRGRIDKVQVAINRIREHEPPEGYYVAFSGGKDSIVTLDLVRRAGVAHEAHFNRAMEAPEVIYFIRKYYPNVTRHLPKKNFFAMIEEQGISPFRTMPYCCRILKEQAGNDRIKIMGVRRQESRYRKDRPVWSEERKVLLPIVDWSLSEVWMYIRATTLPYPSLYDEGYKRIGCVMCPKAGAKQMKKEAIRWPKIAQAIENACCRAYDPAIARDWKDGHDMYRFWMSGKGFTKTEGGGLFDEK